MHEQNSEFSGESQGSVAAVAGDAAQGPVPENPDYLASTLDSIAAGVISTDQAGRIVRINRNAQQLTGWTLMEAQGFPLKEVFQLVVGAKRKDSLSLSADALCWPAGENQSLTETLVSRNGKRYLVEVSTSAICNGRNASQGEVVLFKDVTEKIRLETAVQHTRRLEAIGRLAAGVAHDFNNLLAGISGYTEMLVIELRGDPRLQSYAHAILGLSQRAATVVRQLMAFSGQGKRQTLPTDVHNCLSTIVALMRSTTVGHLAITTRLTAPAPVVMADPRLLEAALLYLMANASEATPVHGVITIETCAVQVTPAFIARAALDIAPGDYMEITIADTGVGMSETVKGHLYEPFFTTKEIGRGTGLGLAAVYGTVKEHRGGITIMSSLGRGTSFKIYLPICGLPAAAECGTRSGPSRKLSGTNDAQMRIAPAAAAGPS